MAWQNFLGGAGRAAGEITRGAAKGAGGVLDFLGKTAPGVLERMAYGFEPGAHAQYAQEMRAKQLLPMQQAQMSAQTKALESQTWEREMMAPSEHALNLANAQSRMAYAQAQQEEVEAGQKLKQLVEEMKAGAAEKGMSIEEYMQTPEAQEKILEASPETLFESVIKGRQKRQEMEGIFNLMQGGEAGAGMPEGVLEPQTVAVGPSGTTVTIGKKTQVPSGERQQINQFKSVLATAERIKKSFKPEYVGWWEEKTVDIREVLPSEIGGMSPEEVAWRNDLTALIESMYAMSGKQLSDKEMAIIGRMLPRGKLTAETFPAALDRFIFRLTERLELTESALRGAGFRMPPAQNVEQEISAIDKELAEIERQLKEK